MRGMETKVGGMMRERTTLQTRRLLLRPYQVEDADDLFAVQSDEEFVRYLLDAWPTREGIAQGLARAVAAPWGQNPNFAIVLDGRVIGGINLIIDDSIGLGMLNYGMARWVRGQGLATEAGAAVVEYGFQVCGLAKVWARVDPRNHASVRVLEKLGMQEEGLLRGVAIRHGERSTGCMSACCGRNGTSAGQASATETGRGLDRGHQAAALASFAAIVARKQPDAPAWLGDAVIWSSQSLG